MPGKLDTNEKLICGCGRIYLRMKRYSVYEQDFCSMVCLRKFKEVEDAKRKPKNNSSTYINTNYGGGPPVS